MLGRAMFAIAAVAVAVAACSPSPVVPACKSDVACAKADHHDYCVAGGCAQCRTAMDCGSRERCRVGHCEADPDAPIPPEPVEAGPPPDEPEPPPPRKRRRVYDYD